MNAHSHTQGRKIRQAATEAIMVPGFVESHIEFALKAVITRDCAAW